MVEGINLLTLLWSEGESHIPCDYRVYDKANDGKGKNAHFADLLHQAKQRGFPPEYILFDSWYSSLVNLKLIRSFKWHWLTRLKANRHVNPDRTGNIPVSEATISEQGTQVHLKGYGFIKVFKIVSLHGDLEYWATDHLNMNEFGRLKYSELAWKIENYHRGLKQYCGVERAQVRAGRAQRNHIGFAIRAFLRLEVYYQKTGVSWFESKTDIVRGAIKKYLAHPYLVLNPTA